MCERVKENDVAGSALNAKNVSNMLRPCTHYLSPFFIFHVPSPPASAPAPSRLPPLLLHMHGLKDLNDTAEKLKNKTQGTRQPKCRN